MSLVRTLATWLKLTKQSSQSQINEEDPASFADLSVLSEAITRSSHDKSVSMNLEEQVKLKGFIRFNSGETRFAGQPYKLLLIATPRVESVRAPYVYCWRRSLALRSYGLPILTHSNLLN